MFKHVLQAKFGCAPVMSAQTLYEPMGLVR